jgi:aminoglycoside 3-N-acetyltransferase I
MHSVNVDPARAFVVRRLLPGDAALMDALCAVFSAAFEDPASYTSKRPAAAYTEGLLGRDSFIAITALKGDQVVGGLVAYELHKFEQARSEVYIYDLAVAAEHRRQGIATALIEALQAEARRRGAWVVYVQADHGDDPAIALYTRLGVREDVLHFDIPVHPTRAQP